MSERDTRLLEAVDLAFAGDWAGAHRIAQEREGDDLANWIHAIAHRMEGDLENARYWCRRCRREPGEESSTGDELLEIREALRARQAFPANRRRPALRLAAKYSLGCSNPTRMCTTT